MNTSLRPTRLASCLALVAVALVGCSESDLEELHDERLDDAVAARAASPEPDGSTTPALGGAEPIASEGPSPDPDPEVVTIGRARTGSRPRRRGARRAREHRARSR